MAVGKLQRSDQMNFLSRKIRKWKRRQARNASRVSESYLSKYQHTAARPSLGETDNDLSEIFWSNTGAIVNKWHHYLPIYDHYFNRFRGRPIKMLEIGVAKGGSLKMWREYFGPQAVIFGVDIDPKCAVFDGQYASVRIGSQDDADFMRGVIAEMGGVDIVLDDGSHVGRHIRSSLDVVFPLLSENGVYMIEDLHAAYWSDYDGATKSPHNFMKVVKQLVDDMHHWYHPRGQVISATAGKLGALHIHDSIVVLDKATQTEPRQSQVGSSEV
jgi:hypothetical protein